MNLDDSYSRELMYRVVLLEAGRVEDLARWLERVVLVRSWPELYLPSVVRAAWEERHPELRRQGAGPSATGSHGFALAGGNALWPFPTGEALVDGHRHAAGR
jgi:hypothetical protein